MASNAVPSGSRLSDDDIDRIVLQVRAIIMSEMKILIDSSIRETKREYDDRIKKLETKYDFRIQKLETDNGDLKDENDELRSELCEVRIDIGNMKWKDDEIEQYSRRNSLRISGIQESDTRPPDDIVLELANEYNINIEQSDIDRSHRTGKEEEGNVRAILVKFTSYRARREFMSKKQDLADGIYFNEDLTRLRGEILYESRKLFKADRLFGAWSFAGRVFVKDTKGEKHEVKSVDDVIRLASRRLVKRTANQKKSARSGAASNESQHCQ